MHGTYAAAGPDSNPDELARAVRMTAVAAWHVLRVWRAVAYLRAMRGEPNTPTAAARVLLVEDDHDLLEILSLVLGNAGLDVRAVANLGDARAELARKDRDFAAVVTDKNLPDGNGLTLLSEARAIGLDAELVMITGYPSIDSVVQALRLGVYDYLEKPFRNLEDVAATVLRACEHRRVRRERDEARARAVLAERRATLVQVAAGLAHEVKNPLQGIGFACVNLRETLREGTLAAPALADAEEQLSLIEAESRRLRDLVEGVMDLARPAPRPRYQVAVQRLIGSVLALHAARAAQGSVALRADAPEDLALRIDEADVSRALDNLVRNALDVAPAGSTVTVRGARGQGRNEGTIELSVADQGPGFPPEVRAQVFTPFFTTKARGFGLGLCMVAAAADRAGGRVEIQENIPRGARVVLHLPTD